MPIGDGVYLQEGRVYLNRLGSLPAQAYARCIMEDKLGRSLLEDEVVHHIDRDILNDHPSNLQVMKRSEHAKLHATGRLNSEETKKKIRAGHAGKQHSEETKKRMSAAHLGKLKSEETKLRISKAKTEYWKKWRLNRYGTNS